MPALVAPCGCLVGLNWVGLLVKWKGHAAALQTPAGGSGVVSTSQVSLTACLSQDCGFPASLGLNMLKMTEVGISLVVQ